jgi:tryptophanyl-tRNA synthetase
MSIVTDSKGESPENVYNIHSFFKDASALGALYKAHRGNYKALKEALVDDIEAVVAPMRARRNAITDEEVKQILKHGARRAKERASAKMTDIREKIGVSL